MTPRDCTVCWPRGVQCQGECEGQREATHVVIVGSRPIAPLHGVTPASSHITKPMCHTCAVNERTEKDWSKTDD